MAVQLNPDRKVNKQNSRNLISRINFAFNTTLSHVLLLENADEGGLGWLTTTEKVFLDLHEQFFIKSTHH